MGLQLIESAAQISQILYADECKRSPRMILKLFNTTWLHFELCKLLLSSPKTVSHRKMFGIYLHSLCVHAPVQYELINLKSTNTEHEERLFGQAKDIASRASNHQPNTIVPSILLRLQAKQKTRALYTTYHQMCSTISKAANELNQQMENTKISCTFLTTRSSSWQAHLKRIGPFLQQGPGVWWEKMDDEGAYEFFDGSTKPDYREEGPTLTHFRDTSAEDTFNTKETVWTDICARKVKLPTESLCVYDDQGDFRERVTFSSTTCAEETTKECSDAGSDADSDAGSDSDEEVHPEQEVESSTLVVNYEEVDITSQTEATPTYKTKFATAEYQGIGDSTLLRELDELRHSIRVSTDKVSRSTHTTYKKLMQVIKARIKTKILETKEALKHFENSFYRTKYYPMFLNIRVTTKICTTSRSLFHLQTFFDLT